ncbi:MAG: Uncharacterised protein [Opitutia bacterium UBA7350]|nr:MAG: Uncharacterised protein [Opitutae bacterium UBA7350]
MKGISKLVFYCLFTLGLICLVLNQVQRSTPNDDTKSKPSIVEENHIDPFTASPIEPSGSETDIIVHPPECPCGQHQQGHQKSSPKATERYPSLKLPKDFINALGRNTPGDPIRFDLPEGSFASGHIQGREFDLKGQIIAIEGTLHSPKSGRFMFRREILAGNAWPMSGVVIFDEGNYAYRIEPSTINYGTAELIKYPLDEVICNNFKGLKAEAIPESETTEILPEDHPTDIPIPDYQNGVIPLESLPGTAAVLYLDFDGEAGPHGSWGDFDAHPATNLSLSNIFQIWRRVAEDFAPFNFNVTTDLQVYLDAPENSRQRCIITPTDDAYPGAGGVAYLRSFDWSGDTPCWAFYSSGKSAAEVISHELGHTLDLRHDGQTDPSEDYYSGHASGDIGWAPIMGVGYYKTLTHWSKGEYANANQSQDDIQIIAYNNNNVGIRTDDHGNTRELASYLEIFSDDSVDSDGTISTATDVDAFNFTTTGGQTTLSIDPESYGPNLDIYAALFNDQGTLIQSSNPDTRTDATLSTNLSAGNYTIKISGTGRGDPLAYGYTDYGSLGSYSITGTAVGGVEVNYTPTMANPSNATIYENAYPGTPITDFIASDTNTEQTLTYTISGGNSAGIFSLDASNGKLSLTSFNALDAQSTPNHTIEVSVTDNGNPAKSTTASVQISVLSSSAIKATGPVQEFWNNISGTNLTSLYNDANWPEFPDAINQGNNFQGLSNYADNYGSRIRTHLTPETTGDYTFYISSDNVSSLILSSDATAANGNQIATVGSWTGVLSWNEFSSQASNPITLVAGQSYFIEARLKEGNSADHLAVGWTGPNISTVSVIPAERLSPYDSNTAPTFSSSSYTFNLANNALVDTVIGSVSASSQSFENILYNTLGGDDQNVFSLNPNTGQITLTQPNLIIPGQIFDLTIGAQDNGYGGLFPLKESSVKATITISGTPIQTWRGQNFGNDIANLQITSDLIDPDNDQINNLLEYAFNLNPLQSDEPSNLPQIQTANNKLDFIYRKNLNATDLSYTIMQATELKTPNPWSAASVLSEEIISDDGSTRLIRATLANPNNADKRFIRLQVDLP